METTFEPSFPSFRNRMIVIEAIELAILGFLFWGLLAMIPTDTPENFWSLLSFLVITEIVVLGTWAIYNIYIRVARAGGRFVDIGIWVLASVLTGTFTFWTWIILDINRWILSKLVYRGEAPVEFAFSWRSKLIRKIWEQARKEGRI